MRHINKCLLCKAYTMSETCKCGGKAVKSAPPKFSPHDLYASYRRTAKKADLERSGLL